MIPVELVGIDAQPQEPIDSAIGTSGASEVGVGAKRRCWGVGWEGSSFFLDVVRKLGTGSRARLRLALTRCARSRPVGGL